MDDFLFVDENILNFSGSEVVMIQYLSMVIQIVRFVIIVTIILPEIR